MDLTEERNIILDMVAEGRISVDEAKQLLDALEISNRKKEPADDFCVSPGMDFHIPEVRVPNVNRIIHNAYRHAKPGFDFHSEDLDEMRDKLEDEMEILRDEMEMLKEETKNISEEIKEQLREHKHKAENWEP